MARLIDDLTRFGFENPRLSNRGFHPEYGEQIPGYLPWTALDHKTLLRQTTVIEVDDVAQMFYTQSPDSSALNARKFPCVVPPLDTCFIEFRTDKLTGVRKAGLLVLRLPDVENAAIAIKFLDRRTELEMSAAAQWRWDDSGSLIPPFVHMAPFAGCDLASVDGDFLNLEFAVMLTAFSLLSCKNVVLRDALIPVKASKAHVKRCGSPLFRYKVLDVLPFQQAIRAAGNPSNDETIIKALHICRGHFKDYREHGLFGKTKAVFWWQPHVRGKLEAGMVVKDYAVKL